MRYKEFTYEHWDIVRVEVPVNWEDLTGDPSQVFNRLGELLEEVRAEGYEVSFDHGGDWEYDELVIVGKRLKRDDELSEDQRVLKARSDAAKKGWITRKEKKRRAK